jgi:hypothetical protein
MNKERDKPTKKQKLIILLALWDILLGFAAVATEFKFIDTFFGIFVLISGSWMLTDSLKSIWKTLQSKRWHEVPYQVTDTSFSMQMTSAQHHNKFTPYFKIIYSYQGKSYTRTSKENLNLPVTYVFATPHRAESYLEEVRQFKYGDTVFVNPADPTVAYLKTGIGRDRYGMLLFSIILVVLPLLTLTGIIEWR